MKTTFYVPTLNSEEVNPNIEFKSNDETPRSLEFCLSIESEDTFETDVIKYINIFQFMTNKISLGGAIHEIVEYSLFARINPTDPYWRWFSDGVANNVTYELLKKYFGSEYADNFIKSYDIKKYEDIRKEINLYYWMSGKYCISLMDMPTETGNNFNMARYAYATFEVHRLIDDYRIECIKNILDAISIEDSKTGANLLITIRNVTGEDMFLRMAIYQDFENKQEGLKKYTERLKNAVSKNDYEQIAFNLFRIHDLRFPTDNAGFFNDYRNAAMCLFKIGLEKEADSIMIRSIELLSSSGTGSGRKAALEAFCIYAVDTGKPLKAKKYAEELLKMIPDNEAALTIKIMVLLSDNQTFQAKEIAQQIIKNSKSKETPGYRIASQVIAIDPNQIKPTP